MSNRDDGLDQRVGTASAVRTLFEEVPVSLIGTEGPRHRIVAANAAFRASARRAGLVGHEFAEVFPEVMTQQIFRMLDRVYATGEPHTSTDWRVQLDRDDGSGTLGEVYLSFTVFPRHTPDGTVNGLGAVLLDVTPSVLARQAAEQQVAEAERRASRAQDVVTTLQVELLPAGVPVHPQVQIAASYLLADAGSAAGGDWFDALILDDGRVALVVGDVVGHGAMASAVMGQLRVLLADRLAETGDLVAALTAVDRTAARLPGARAATVCVAVLDPGSGRLDYCTAGHPPPLLLPARGEAHYLPVTGSGPLGVGSTVVSASARLEIGAQLLLYTDGILERPGRPLAETTVELAQVVADVAAGRALRGGDALPVERVCSQTLELLVRTTGYADDITLLAAQRVAPARDFALRVPADPHALAGVRAKVGRWLAELGVSPPDAFSVQHVIGELVTNAIEHAYPDVRRLAEVVVTAGVSPDGELHAEVRDSGRWREPDGAPGRGRGLWLSAELVESLVIDRGEDGTTARLRHRLFRPARLLTEPSVLPGVAPAPPPDAPELLLVLEEPVTDRPRIRVDGPIDGATAPQLHRDLLRATTAGARSLTVDLTGVTLLASVGVAVLHAAVERSAVQGGELRLYAPAGSPAQQILALVALPHTTSDPDVPVS